MQQRRRQDQEPLIADDYEDEDEGMVTSGKKTSSGYVSVPLTPLKRQQKEQQQQGNEEHDAMIDEEQDDRGERRHFTKGLELSNYPWPSWIGCAAVAGIPWLLLLLFPLTKAVWIFCGLFLVLGLVLATTCDWVSIQIDPVSGLFSLKKSSLYRVLARKVVEERFALQDIRRVRVLWLGEREMRRHIRAARRPCCHSHRTAIQASTILVVTISGSSMFQLHNQKIARSAAPAIEEMAGSDITSASHGRLNITIREVQDLLGLEKLAVKSLHQWAAQINEALNLELETPPLN